MPAELSTPLMEAAPAVGVERMVLTIINDVGPTSMPFNEFVVYRAGNIAGERHTVLSWGPLNAPRMMDTVAPAAAANIRVRVADEHPATLRRLCQVVLEEARASAAPLIVHLHQPKSGIVFQLVRRTLATRVPVLFTVHNTYDKYSWPNRVLSAVNFATADAVTFVSQSAAKAYPAALRCSRVLNRAVPNGVDMARVDALVARAVGSSPVEEASPLSSAGSAGLRLINIGRFVEQKNHRFLIDLMANLPQSTALTLVGDGPLRPRVLEWARARGLVDRIRFTGLISREEVYRELLGADVFVSGSLWEGLPIAVLEAMALRKPVLLSDIGPHREIADVGPACRILPLDVEQWRTQLGSWRAGGRDQLAQVGAENRRTVEQHLSLARMHQEYTQLYQRLAAPVGATRP